MKGIHQVLAGLKRKKERLLQEIRLSGLSPKELERINWGKISDPYQVELWRNLMEVNDQIESLEEDLNNVEKGIIFLGFFLDDEI